MTNSDDELRRLIDAELASDPRVNAAQIGVSAEEGTVSLSGTVDSYAEKDAAEAAARRIAGVRAVTQQLKVKIQIDTTAADVEATHAEAQIVDQNEMMN
jgi:osmotically-inducible protein OsmY